jgi:alcohol dehydrogenase (cytochrome c)
VTAAGENWLIGGGDLANSRYSPLNQINRGNVSGLKLAWSAQLYAVGDSGARNEAQPICCPNGLMYVATNNGLDALSPANGQIAWKYLGPKYDTVNGPVYQIRTARNESFNPKLNLVYVGQQDGSIVALDAKTGSPRWNVQVVGAGSYGSANVAESCPFTIYYDDGGDGIVLSAPNGSDTPSRGHLDAYDAKTGGLVWRSWTTPDPTQVPYASSWGNPAEASFGGATVWSPPAVNPQLGLIYFGTGNAYPYARRQPGKDLWTASLMAINWKTGALRWYFQFVKHDIWDMDAPHPVQILNVPINGKMTQVVAAGDKDGYMYVLAAKNGGRLPNFGMIEQPTYDPTGKGISLNNLPASQTIPTGAAGCMVPVDYTPQGLSKCGFPSDLLKQEFGGVNNVNVQPDGSLKNFADGLPIIGTPPFPASIPTAYYAWGTVFNGLLNWPPSSYSPTTHYQYTCVWHAPGAWTTLSNGGISPGVAGLTTTGIASFYDALNLSTNTMAWRYVSMSNTDGICTGGSLTTAGNLSFTAFGGRRDITADQAAAQGVTLGGSFVAFDATNGKILWRYTSPNDGENAPAISYMYKGKQYIAIYSSVPATGPGSTGTGQTDQLRVFSL